MQHRWQLNWRLGKLRKRVLIGTVKAGRSNRSSFAAYLECRQHRKEVLMVIPRLGLKGVDDIRQRRDGSAVFFTDGDKASHDFIVSHSFSL